MINSFADWQKYWQIDLPTDKSNNRLFTDKNINWQTSLLIAFLADTLDKLDEFIF